MLNKKSTPIVQSSNKIKRKSRRTFFESLESRILLSTIDWSGGTSNLWSDRTNWVDEATNAAPATSPTVADNVYVKSTANITLDVDADHAKIASLSVY